METTAARIAAPPAAPLAAERNERLLMWASLALLLLSCVEPGPVRTVAAPLWLASVAVLAVANLGAAFGVYIASVALLSTRYFEGLGSPFQRADNYAFLLIVAIVLVRVRWNVSRRDLWRAALVAGAFVVYGIIHLAWIGTFTHGRLSWYMRMYGVPVFLCILFASRSWELREVRALVAALAFLGLYMSVVSFLERLGWYDLLFPGWLADPVENVTIGSGRSGGVLMQSEWNGLILSLILAVLVLAMRLRLFRHRAALAITAALCLLAIYFTYTRAAWLGVAVGAMVLLTWRAGSSTGADLKLAAAALGGALLLGFLLFFPTNMTEQRLGNVGNIYFRFNLWNTGLAMAMDRPLFGYGFASFAQDASPYADALQVFPESRPEVAPESVLHNTTLTVLVELGLIGFLLYAGVLLEIVRRARDALSALWGRDGVVWLFAFVLVYIVQIQFVNAHEPTTNYLFYGFVGVLWGLAPAAREGHNGRPSAVVRRRRASDAHVQCAE